MKTIITILCLLMQTSLQAHAENLRDAASLIVPLTQSRIEARKELPFDNKGFNPVVKHLGMGVACKLATSSLKKSHQSDRGPNGELGYVSGHTCPAFASAHSLLIDNNFRFDRDVVLSYGLASIVGVLSITDDEHTEEQVARTIALSFVIAYATHLVEKAITGGANDSEGAYRSASQPVYVSRVDLSTKDWRGILSKPTSSSSNTTAVSVLGWTCQGNICR